MQQSQEDLNRAQAVAQTGSWRLDVRRNTLTWSDETHRIFGIPKETPMTYETFISFVHPEDRGYVDSKWHASLKGEEYDIEHRIIVGKVVKWVREKAQLEFDENGLLQGGFGTVQDITERKRMEERLAAQKRLAYLGTMAGTIAHEVRNPLATVDTSAFYLERTLKDAGDKPKEHLRRIRTGVDRAANIIEKLLEMSRMKEPQVTPVELCRFMANMISAAKVPLGIDVILNTQNEEIKVMVDDEQFRMAIGNILKNAVEALPDGGTLTVNVCKVENQAEVSIKDTGPGIPPENFPRLFEPLFTTKPGGVGFGLALARTVLEKHGGNIEAKSEPGKGATFIVRLPLFEKSAG